MCIMDLSPLCQVMQVGHSIRLHQVSPKQLTEHRHITTVLEMSIIKIPITQSVLMQSSATKTPALFMHEPPQVNKLLTFVTH